MELALPERFDTRQALRYLGISTEEPDSATRALLRRAERTLRAAAGPRAVAVRAARDDISPYLQGNDILRHLEGCGSCVLLACTLGAGVDAQLVRLLLPHLVLGQAGAAIGEQVLDPQSAPGHL